MSESKGSGYEGRDMLLLRDGMAEDRARDGLSAADLAARALELAAKHRMSVPESDVRQMADLVFWSVAPGEPAPRTVTISEEHAEERAWVGAVLVSGRVSDASALEPMAMTDPVAAPVARALVEMAAEGAAPDVVLVLAKLRDGRCGVTAVQLGNLIQEAGSTARIAEYRRAVLARAAKRAAIAGIEGLRAQLADGVLSPAMAEADADRIIGSLAHSAESERSIADLVVETLDGIEKGKFARGLVGFGLVDLDRVAAMRPGELVVVAARPGVGKTSLGLHVLRHMGRTGTRAICYSLEVSSELICADLIAAESRVPAKELRENRLNEAEWSSTMAGAGRLSAMPIRVVGASGWTAKGLRASLLHARAQRPVGLVIVDYLQLVSAPRGAGRDRGREQEVAGVVRDLKSLAIEADCPILALVQVNRAPEGRSDRKPRLGDLRESGAIEADADTVILLHPIQTDGSVIEAIIAKQRHGPLGSEKIAFLGRFKRFENLSEAQEPAQDWINR